ncbi:probable G-protein coupled receptor 132 isoform X2 [Dunckerocampus dactyliophorus]|uniref:probable G-protein coupled receptor 132 isoform X2 n=1 Tax=Dunckerocampus dactyliophorus TaxID=161453 RepID=UPI002405498C|nr:probable G-protein coupled receptor 132 isoform X2 [Dunckerocampus dactyliophorus]
MSNDSCGLPLDTDVLGLTCIYGLVFSLGLPSNLLSLWGLYHLGRGNGSCQQVYILNLLLSDLLQLLTLPLWILYLQGNHRWPYGRLTCELVGYVFYVNVYASVMFLCLIALDRCLAIVFPLSSRRYPVSLRHAHFKITTVALGFLLPCAILGYTSAHIGVTLRRSPTLSAHERHKIVGILVVITVNFIVVFGPYHLVGGYRFASLLWANEPCALERAIFLLYRLCYGLTSLNALLDPLFYIFLCADARLELRKALPCSGRGQNIHKKTTTAHQDAKGHRESGHNNLFVT